MSILDELHYTITMEVTCTQCGGAVKIEGESPFLSCGYCQSTFFAGRGLSIDTWLVRPLLSKDEGIANVTTFLTGAGVNIDEILIQGEQLLLPFAEYEGTINQVIVPLYLMKVSLNSFKTITGDKEAYSGKELPHWKHLLPDQKSEETLDWKSQKKGKTFHIVYYPFYIINYSINDNEFMALVDAVTGEAFADEIPASLPEQGRYLFAVFLIASFILYFLPFVVFDSSIKYLMAVCFLAILSLAPVLPVLILLYIVVIVLFTTGIVS